MCSKLALRLKTYIFAKIEEPKITVLYSNPNKGSNTLNLWNMVSKHLENFEITTILIENGKIQDCKGCSYKLCVHYGKHNSCFYGGIMVQDVLPSIEKSDGVIWLCPNYNDSYTANISATINRLTVLYNKINFYNKNMFGIIVSGNSGSDSVSKQLIGSLNINKGFNLAPNSILTATSNDPNAILQIDDIEDIAKTILF